MTRNKREGISVAGCNSAPQIFIGWFESKVYRSGKIHIPADWRAHLDGCVVVARDVAEPNTVCLMPEKWYEEELVISRSENYPLEQREALMAARRLRIDACGRVKLPDELLALLGVSGRVTLIGRVRTMWVIPYKEQPVIDEEALSAALDEVAER